MKTVAEIRDIFRNCPIKDLKELILEYENDDRKGVKNLVIANKKRLDNYYKEVLRLKNISKYENMYLDKGYKFIAGIDEVGRGPLAGPVVACALIYPEGIIIEGIKDSKKLSKKRRNEIFWQIEKSTADIGLGIVEPEIIDEINILNATKLAMKRAVENLSIKPDILLIDALRLEEVEIEQLSIEKGDDKSISIGAASIVAKVMRDEMMHKYSREYQGYKFETNMGYGTQEHIDAIKELGLTPIHRRSFVTNIV